MKLGGGGGSEVKELTSVWILVDQVPLSIPVSTSIFVKLSSPVPTASEISLSWEVVIYSVIHLDLIPSNAL